MYPFAANSASTSSCFAVKQKSRSPCSVIRLKVTDWSNFNVLLNFLAEYISVLLVGDHHREYWLWSAFNGIESKLRPLAMYFSFKNSSGVSNRSVIFSIKVSEVGNESTLKLCPVRW